MSSEQTKFTQAGLEKAEKPEKEEKPLSEIEDPTERKLERLKREYQPLTN